MDGLESMLAVFEAAQRAVRLSPQPGLRADADRFKLLVGQWSNPPRPPPTPQAPPWRQLLASVTCLPPPVEDFVGRASDRAAIAQTFTQGRRVVWLHGAA
eukprot:CAMPEP_0170585332 /NCGR_PEP_ID=MMETSP0224-20130122/9155_1 /TAXON_ID=285029 /ORGANISM="Togula jolla, Strain CCCM 725" /LENGTH=99 /DNA_ID=CAMNT_0010908805 /DNA_START=1 /DNA_END=297 /DNA_ORIENTATION=+